ncbi:hypothetical protein L1889_07910 [Paenalcaligenes niemegkensis]|uniref:hypothetical protein n=1 Tax=Paenalcaligenes niemegkensis TaxID=2895469 RepID=UPI001EE95729|nr:hypothetical protein [Paenalcaligenes niemegkensis]MCQ9616642.1 hypothetical protein [Paenalcaligenes niemegkensis]
MDQLQSQKAAKDERRKLLSKTEVIRWLLITLPALEAEFMQAMNTIKQEFTLSYVPTFEREARREGKQEER